MTFSQMVTQVGDYCNLTSTEATTRIGKSINRHYRRITSELGLDVTRFVTRSVAMTIGFRTVTFPEIEKIDRVIDMTDGTAIRVLTEVSQHTQRTTQPGASYPSTWSLQHTEADAVTILTDTVADADYSLQADGRVTLSDLSGSDEPVFPESYHDILSWYVIAEELLKKEKDKLARIYESKADKLLSELRFFLADSPTLSVRARNAPSSSPGGSGGGGGTVAVAAGSDGQVQYNNGGVLGGSGAFTFNDITNVVMAAGGVNTAVVELTAGQIFFPAAANPSANPNVLDDYEEGTFAPTLTGTGGGSGQAYAQQVGHYVKVGKLVQFSVYLELSTLGTVTGQAVVGNLPFTSNATGVHAACVGYWSAFTSSMCFVSGLVPTGNTVVLLYGSTAAATGLSAVVQADLSNTSILAISGSYKANA